MRIRKRQVPRFILIVLKVYISSIPLPSISPFELVFILVSFDRRLKKKKKKNRRLEFIYRLKNSRTLCSTRFEERSNYRN